MLIGTLLVLMTWLVAIASLILVGLPVGLTRISQLSAGRLRRSMWLGLLLVTVVLLGSSLIWPLSSGSVLAVMIALVLTMGAVTAVMGFRPKQFARRNRSGFAKRTWAPLLVALILVAAFLAVAALGPVTNYDTGLYHLGAIRYVADFGTIPGLANLFNPFGYANSQFVLAAFLGNGPWAGNGYRLINGLLVLLLLLDLLLRFLRPSRKPGDYVLLIGSGLIVVPLLGLADYLVTSPTSDTAVMILTLIASAYLTDAAVTSKWFAGDASVAIGAAVLAFLMRPTMVAFLGFLLIALVLLYAGRPRKSPGELIPVVLISALSLAGVGLQAVRDYYLSGWLFYPLSLHGFDVPWRTLDPAANRDMTLAVARNPVDYVNATHGWAWVGPWLRRLPQQWETYEIALSVVIVIACLVSAKSGRPLRIRRLIVVIAPAGLSVMFWWLLTPPSFRFAWGPIFASMAIPAGWFLWRARPSCLLARVSTLLVTAVLTLLVSFCSVTRIHPDLRTAQAQMGIGALRIGYSLAPIPVPPTVERELPTGVRLLYPTQSDQCWGAYPLCTYFTDTNISYRGDGIGEGFLP